MNVTVMNTTAIGNLTDRTDSIEAKLAIIEATADTAWVLMSAYLVFFMQCGFAMLEAGSVRYKNTQNILIKNTLDACIAALAFWLFGYCFAYGDKANNAFIGWDVGMIATNDFNDWAAWLFQFAFAGAAATIVSGAMAERTNFYAYLIYSFIITGWVYPVVVHWGWSNTGWLSPFADPIVVGANGMLDFAGSGIVHLTGGIAALIGAIMVGPRKGRFKKGNESAFRPHNAPLASLGLFILWFGWYGFNAGSTLGVSGGLIDVAAKVAVNTTLAPAAGGLVVLFFGKFVLGEKWSLYNTINGILAGLVGITAGCSLVEPWAAVLIGSIAGGVYLGAAQLLLLVRVDDPIGAFPVHGACGIWGVLSTGLFATRDNLEAAYGSTDNFGGFYGGGGRQFGMQLLGVLSIVAWVGTWSVLLFGGLKLLGILRVSDDKQEVGMDLKHHGGPALILDSSRSSETSGSTDVELANVANVEESKESS